MIELRSVSILGLARFFNFLCPEMGIWIEGMFQTGDELEARPGQAIRLGYGWTLKSEVNMNQLNQAKPLVILQVHVGH